MWLCIAVACGFLAIWYIDREEKDHLDYMRARRAEVEREAMHWFALLEERERQKMTPPIEADWKKEGF